MFTGGQAADPLQSAVMGLMGLFRSTGIVALLWLAGNIGATAQLRVLAIGDSLTEEYAFEVPFSAPDSDPLDANTRNWVEILAEHRPAQFSMGSYAGILGSYPDLRNGGFKFNYGVPSLTAAKWVRVVQSSLFQEPEFYSTKLALTRHLENEVDVALIVLGGNDLKTDYSGIFNDPEPPNLLAETVANLEILHDFVRSRNPGLPIVIATAPDIGATPEVAAKYTDPDLRARARARIAAMNASIIALATTKSATVMRVDTLTDRIFDENPLHLNGTRFSLVPHPENPPTHMFCKDGFHPATPGQALMAGLAVQAINQACGSNLITPLGNREILGNVLGLNPDQPYLDWAAAAGVTGNMQDDSDGDGLPNLAEFLLGSHPGVANSPLHWLADQTLAFKPDPHALRFAALRVADSDKLAADWQAVPPARITHAPDGGWRIAPLGPRRFYRLAAEPRP
jgi:lysophospholipase L1-like esterase